MVKLFERMAFYVLATHKTFRLQLLCGVNVIKVKHCLCSICSVCDYLIKYSNIAVHKPRLWQRLSYVASQSVSFHRARIFNTNILNNRKNADPTTTHACSASELLDHSSESV